MLCVLSYFYHYFNSFNLFGLLVILLIAGSLGHRSPHLQFFGRFRGPCVGRIATPTALARWVYWTLSITEGTFLLASLTPEAGELLEGILLNPRATGWTRYFSSAEPSAVQSTRRGCFPALLPPSPEGHSPTLFFWNPPRVLGPGAEGPVSPRVGTRHLGPFLPVLLRRPCEALPDAGSPPHRPFSHVFPPIRSILGQVRSFSASPRLDFRRILPSMG